MQIARTYGKNFSHIISALVLSLLVSACVQSTQNMNSTNPNHNSSISNDINNNANRATASANEMSDLSLRGRQKIQQLERNLASDRVNSGEFQNEVRALGLDLQLMRSTMQDLNATHRRLSDALDQNTRRRAASDFENLERISRAVVSINNHAIALEGDLRQLNNRMAAAQAQRDADRARAARADAERQRTAERQQAAQNARAMRDQYAQRPKTLLEQILNYTTHSNENGIIGEELSEFWVSGHQGAHKCILTFVRIESTGLIGLFEAIANIAEQRTAMPRQIDIRRLNERGFTVRMEFTNNLQSYFSIGDEQQRIFNRQRQQPVQERLHRAWRLAFQECPGTRTAF